MSRSARRRRRAVVAGAVGLAVAGSAVLATNAAAGGGPAPAPAPAARVKPVPVAAPAAAKPVPKPKPKPVGKPVPKTVPKTVGKPVPRPAPGPAAEQSSTPLGAVVATGLAGPSGTRVLYAVRVADKGLPGTRFGVMLGHRAGGRLVDDVLANEFQGSDRSPGFHAVSDAMSTARGDVGVFGYYAGPVAKVTATVGGRTVQAKLARWSEDRTVAFFWFAERDVPDGSTAAGLTAFDAQGKRLPAGNTDVGVG